MLNLFKWVPALLLGSVWPNPCWSLPNALFHGTSIVIVPSPASHHPANSSFFSANFFSYLTPQGYFSFGWWLPAEPGTNSSHCVPSPLEIDWYEYTTSANCEGAECRVHAINRAISDPDRPVIDDDYVFKALSVGNGERGELALSYFDKEGGGYAVGTRELLSDTRQGSKVQACHEAFETLRQIQERWHVPLQFRLQNPCSIDDIPGQVPLGQWRT